MLLLPDPAILLRERISPDLREHRAGQVLKLLPGFGRGYLLVDEVHV